MNSTVTSINKDYRSLVKTAQDKFETRWVRKTVMGGATTGTIVRVYLNNAHPAGLKGTIKWEDETTEENVALADLDEYQEIPDCLQITGDSAMRKQNY